MLWWDDSSESDKEMDEEEQEEPAVTRAPALYYILDGNGVPAPCYNAIYFAWWATGPGSEQRRTVALSNWHVSGYDVSVLTSFLGVDRTAFFGGPRRLFETSVRVAEGGRLRVLPQATRRSETRSEALFEHLCAVEWAKEEIGYA